MVNGTTLSIYGLALLFLSFFSGDAASLRMTAPSDVDAGGEFNVTVVIRKGDLESFARFQAKLPYGLTAVDGSADNADFTFDGQTARFVWIRMPNTPEVELNYTVRVDQRMKGNFVLGGTFSYIAENARREVMVPDASVVIHPSGLIPPDRQLDIMAYQETIPAQRNIDMRTLKVRCIRATPAPISGSNDLQVRILVNRGEAVKFAKINEALPAGFTAEPIETKDAIFACQDGEVRFLWMNLPPEPMFQVAYRLIPLDGKEPSIPQMRGEFSFLHDNVTRTVKIVERPVQLENMDAQALEALVREVPIEGGHTPTLANASGGTLEVQGPSEGGVDYSVQYQSIAQMRSSTVSTGGEARLTSSGRRRRAEISMDEYMLTPEEGVYYRVQVAAGHRPININRYFKRLSLKADVRTERHEGWYKYSVGSFVEYRDARDYRMKVWATTPIRDAFVAAYNNGQRITVQEALMITSQRWYK